MIIAHEMGHVVLGHRMDSNFAFFDQLLIDDKDSFRHFGFARTPEEETAANAKAIEMLKNSPYKDQLGERDAVPDGARCAAEASAEPDQRAPRATAFRTLAI